MGDVAIRLQHLGKRYRIGAYRKLKGGGWVNQATGKLSSPFEYLAMMLREPTEAETLWALRDVSFEVRQGEVLGIIGANGAGKSTLLKLLSRITQPSTGRIELFGRVGSMLEVGTGFHPELTGRENVYVNGALLGMRPQEIDRKFDAIVEFSGVEKLLDTMVKYYSSGMFVRLAFAVAAYLEPEILLVDEVLSIGDAAFQKKCLARMDDLTRSGRTILFVSHNMPAIRDLCPETMLIENGSVVVRDQTDRVLERYLAEARSNILVQEWPDAHSAPGNSMARLKRVWIRSPQAITQQVVTRAAPLELGVEYWNLTGAQLHITVLFVVDGNVVAFTSSSNDSPEWQTHGRTRGLVRSVCTIPAEFLNARTYQVSVVVEDGGAEPVLALPDALAFHVVADSRRAMPKSFGLERAVMAPSLAWQTQIVEPRA